MSAGAVSFGADAFADSNAAFAGAMSTTCVSFSTRPTNGWPLRSKVPTLNGTGVPPDCASVPWLQPISATAIAKLRNTPQMVALVMMPSMKTRPFYARAILVRSTHATRTVFFDRGSFGLHISGCAGQRVPRVAQPRSDSVFDPRRARRGGPPQRADSEGPGHADVRITGRLSQVSLERARRAGLVADTRLLGKQLAARAHHESHAAGAVLQRQRDGRLGQRRRQLRDRGAGSGAGRDLLHARAEGNRETAARARPRLPAVSSECRNQRRARTVCDERPAAL